MSAEVEASLQPSAEASMATRAAFVGLTATRLALIPPTVNAIREGDIDATYAFMGAHVGLDVADGIGARGVGADGPARRITDGSVDRAIAWSSFGALASVQPEAIVWCFPYAIRGSFHVAQNAYNFFRKKTVLVGGGWHRLAMVSQVGLGMALVSGAPLSVTATVAGASYATTSMQTMSFRGNSYDLEPQQNFTTKKITGFSGVKKFLQGKKSQSR